MSNEFAKADMAKILFSEEDIQRRIKELAKELSKDYKDKVPIMIAVLRGAILFFLL